MKSIPHSLNESVLYPIHAEICICKDLDVARGIIRKALENAKETRGQASIDLQRMYTKLNSFTTLLALQYWFYNSILAYVNQKVIKPIPTDEDSKPADT